MIKWILILIVLLGLFCYSMIVVADSADRDAHEAYERWKEQKRKEDEQERLFVDGCDR